MAKQGPGATLKRIINEPRHSVWEFNLAEFSQLGLQAFAEGGLLFGFAERLRRNASKFWRRTLRRSGRWANSRERQRLRHGNEADLGPRRDCSPKGGAGGGRWAENLPSTVAPTRNVHLSLRLAEYHPALQAPALQGHGDWWASCLGRSTLDTVADKFDALELRQTRRL